MSEHVSEPMIVKFRPQAEMVTQLRKMNIYGKGQASDAILDKFTGWLSQSERTPDGMFIAWEGSFDGTEPPVLRAVLERRYKDIMLAMSGNEDFANEADRLRQEVLKEQR